MSTLIKEHPVICRCTRCKKKRVLTVRANKQNAELATAIGAVQLGLGLFQVGQSIGTSGSLSVHADTARYVHQNTPAYIPFTKVSAIFKISAHHPRYFIDRQNFYFRLSFEHNKYDLRNVSIAVLRNKSSSLYSSTFNIQFNASAYSQPTNPVAKIIYNIQGRWDPVGLGDVSFDGDLIIKADGSSNGGVDSERNWVHWDGFLPNTIRRTRLPAPPRPGLTPPSVQKTRPAIKFRSRGQSVFDLQTRLNRWLTSQGHQILVVDGVFGRSTRRAVVSFQRVARLEPDGVVGSNTWAVLLKNW